MNNEQCTSWFENHTDCAQVSLSRTDGHTRPGVSRNRGGLVRATGLLTTISVFETVYGRPELIYSAYFNRAGQRIFIYAFLQIRRGCQPASSQPDLHPVLFSLSFDLAL